MLLLERNITPVIARKKNEKSQRSPFDRATYRKRNVIEQCVSSRKRL